MRRRSPLRVARVSLQVLEQTARELVEEDWDLDEALWVLAQVCKVEPQLQLKVGLYPSRWCSGSFRGYFAEDLG